MKICQRIKYLLWAGILFCLAWGTPGVITARGAENVAGHAFYYFNPDSSQSNLGRLKSEMDLFLAQVDPTMTFQPFAHQVDFHNKLKGGNPALIFLPHWCLQEHAELLGLRPLLKPVRNRKTSYRKTLLVASHSALTIKTLQGATLAMTPMGSSSADFLQELLAVEQISDLDSIRVVQVPKDSDALFALALGQVDLALVSEDNLELIGRLNPRIIKTVRPLLATSPIPLPILCYKEGSITQKKIDWIKKAILKNEVTGSKIKEILQVDEWQEFAK